MKYTWNINIEGFSKIDDIKIEVTPIIIFVGENNTGKSLVMSLLYGILNLDYLFSQSDISSINTYKKCDNWLKNITNEKIYIDEYVESMFIDMVNELLNKNIKKLVQDTFNDPMSIDNIFISDYHRDPHIELVCHKNNIIEIEDDKIYIPFDYINEWKSRFTILKAICYKLLTDISNINAENELSNNIAFLPASRAGLMLIYKNLVDESICNKLSKSSKENYAKNFLQLPMLKFLQDLISLRITNKGKYIKIANFIEDKMLKDIMKVENSPLTDYLYNTTDFDFNILPYVTSSLVAELIPIILFLKSKKVYNLMIIEEPEAHLHLQMQRIMARAIVRMANSNLPVCITTHSDIILQQINNLIKLSKNINKQTLALKYGYEKEDFLDPLNIKVYQFNYGSCGKINITPLELSDSGFEVPTFNNSILELSRETIEFETSKNV